MECCDCVCLRWSVCFGVSDVAFTGTTGSMFRGRGRLRDPLGCCCCWGIDLLLKRSLLLAGLFPVVLDDDDPNMDAVSDSVKDVLPIGFMLLLDGVQCVIAM